MKILLLNPPSIDNKAYIREGRCNQEQGVWATLWPPISLATCGAILKNGGHQVEILDCAAQQISFNSFLTHLKKNGRYSLIVYSTATPSINSDLILSDEIKNVDSKVKTAVFGTHVSILSDDCLAKSKTLDFVISNEPEETLKELVACLEQGLDLSKVKGLSYKDANNVIHNEKRSFIKSLDSLPFPAWELLNLDNYRLPLIGEKFLIISPIRGCPYSCTFCTAQTYYGKKLRKKSVRKIIEEIKFCINHFGIKYFFIWADTFTADQNYVINFCQQVIDSKLDIKWTCNSRVDTVDQKTLNIMSKSGCWMISYGFETGNQRILDSIKKKININQSFKAVDMANKAGIKITGHFVLGFPGENKETLNATIKLALSLEIDIAQFYCAVAFPGSYIYTLAMDNGWINEVKFNDFRQDRAIMNLPGLKPSTVNEFRKKAFYKFYIRPRQIFKIIRLMRLTVIWTTIKSGIKFIKWINYNSNFNG